MDLKNKTVLFLGSSVTYGSAAGGISFVDILEAHHGMHCIKEAVSGTTLVDLNERSYVSRLKSVAPTAKPDLFVCQLSTNDATKGLDIKEIEQAIRFILDHVKTTFRCPSVFYTGTYFESDAYSAMIRLLYELKKEYDFYILDLYHDGDMLGVSKEDYARYMKDKIHPTLLGYREWWTPKFVDFFKRLPPVGRSLKIILFKDDREFFQFADKICDRMKEIPSDSEFCGIWGEIQSNECEVLNAISSTVNYFIESGKKEMIFGCCEKDCDKILSKLNLADCTVDKVDVTALLR